MKKNVLIIGNGFLGTNLFETFNSNGVKTTKTYHNHITKGDLQLDITNLDSIQNCILECKPTLIINTAANTDVDFLEKNEKIAYNINAKGAKNIALIAQQEKIRLFHISTDSIFDGNIGGYSEEDYPIPINIYGKTKLTGENLVKENNNDHIIIRTNFYGNNENGKFLFNWILNSLKQNKTITGFDNIIFNPLEISNLCQMIFELSNIKYHGILHLASDETMSKYDFAIKIADVFNLKKNFVEKGSSDNFNFIAKRPYNTELSNKKAKQILSTKITYLSDWLINIKNKE
jgi:dTDP-4-dehydrorhamnose reductase